MNRLHRWLCASARWRTEVETRTLPWVLDDSELGAQVLEIGPGPGVATDVLRRIVDRLTCVEIDADMAADLARRTACGNVTVVRGDATTMPLADASFDAALCLTMLHHVASARLQDRLFAEVARVLRPGALFVGADSLSRPGLRLLHLFDTLVLVDPASLPARLEAAGFIDIRVGLRPNAFRFRAVRARSAAAHS